MIINSFNRCALLERAFDALALALRGLPFGSATVVFEAGSTDGSREYLERAAQENPGAWIEVMRPEPGEDTSFSAGVNAACAHAITAFPRLRWLMLYETDNWVAGPEPLAQACALLAAEPQLAGAGFTVRLHSGKPCGYGMRFPSVWRFVAGQNVAEWWNLDDPNPGPHRESAGVEWFTCETVFTSPLVIRREAWERSGGFDGKEFPFSDSDVDWAWRDAQMGGQLAVIESDAVVHDNLAVNSAWSANRVVDFHRSRLRLLKRHRGVWVGVVKPLLFFRHLAEWLMLSRAARRDPTAEPKLAKRRQMLGSVWRDYVA